MKKYWQILLVIIIPEIIIFTIIFKFNTDKADVAKDNASACLYEPEKMPADHSKFPQLQKHFNSPEEVTKACLECHTERGKEFMMTEHWRWLKSDTMDGKLVELGKMNVPNNFCVGIHGNEKLCSVCHAGYGFKDEKFDFTKEEHIDCIVCHDNTGKYVKPVPAQCLPPKMREKMHLPDDFKGAGYPNPSLDLSYIAQHVGMPKRENCGACHYKGGGGNNVKHGDLEIALNDCDTMVDVHMAKNGANMNCTACHTTRNHKIKGNLYTVSSSNANRASCTQCHTDKPHKSKLLNEHYQYVACQTCHIPTYAKVNPTKIYWDWATAGKMKNGKPYKEEKEISEDTIWEYQTREGTGIYVKNAVPDYVWFNGNAHIVRLGDTVSGDTIVLNKLYGSYADNVNPKDPEHPSKIYPVKIMRGHQLYDPVNKMIINPYNAGPKGSGAFWGDYNWDSAAAKGMFFAGLPYSGKYTFVHTESYWLLNHMVAPASEALTCEACHSVDGRLKNLTGFYLPGRDRIKAVDIGGMIFILLTIIGVVVHGGLRYYSYMKNKNN